MLIGAHGLVEINSHLRADGALQAAFGRSRYAEQSVVQCTLDACTPSIAAPVQPGKTGRTIMNAEFLSLTPTTEQRAKMVYVYIRQSSLMQVTHHGESTDLQHSLVQRTVALGWRSSARGDH